MPRPRLPFRDLDAIEEADVSVLQAAEIMRMRRAFLPKDLWTREDFESEARERGLVRIVPAAPAPSDDEKRPDARAKSVTSRPRRRASRRKTMPPPASPNLVHRGAALAAQRILGTSYTEIAERVGATPTAIGVQLSLFCLSMRQAHQERGHPAPDPEMMAELRAVLSVPGKLLNGRTDLIQDVVMPWADGADPGAIDTRRKRRPGSTLAILVFARQSLEADLQQHGLLTGDAAEAVRAETPLPLL